jgi:hypothetical protein
MTDAVPASLDDTLLCYCTGLTIGQLRAACAAGRWPLADKERTGKLCTGCVGDLLHCLRAFGVSGVRPLTMDAPATDE